MGHPDPRVPPRSIAARARIEEHYTARASDGDMIVDEYRTKLFPVLEAAVTVGPAGSSPGAAKQSLRPTAAPETSQSQTQLGQGVTAVPPEQRAPDAVKSVSASTTASVSEGFGITGTAANTAAEPNELAVGTPVVLVALLLTVVALALCNTVTACKHCRQRRTSNGLGDGPVTIGSATSPEDP